MAKKFSAQVDDYVKQYKGRMRAVALDATLTTINDAQTTVANGGNMRVDTGFLRASGSASLNGMPTGPSRGESDGVYAYNDRNVIAAIGSFKVGASIFWGWTAAYARAREAKDGFLILAVQKWQQTVDASVRKLKNR